MPDFSKGVHLLIFIFPVSLFLSALLLFSIQPMVAKVLLPVYGGTPAVWTICMLFFQFILLASYSYVWFLGLLKKPGLWRLIHTLLVILSLSTFPLSFQADSKTIVPEWDILYALLTQAGLPLLVIGASAPLLQFAYSQTKGKGAADPYFLYIASNFGSLLALLLYPWVWERYIGLTKQYHLWNIGYFIDISLLLFILYTAPYQAQARINHEKKTWPWKEMIYWVALSFIPCSLMMGVTLYISTDVAATPLFWVIPLALYLCSFIVTFTTKPLISQEWIKNNYLFFLIFTILGFILGIQKIIAWQLILFNLAGFFILAVLCHGQLFLRRPKPEWLTLFYLCLAVGGFCAGIFNGILAPRLFNQVYEYPLVILLSLLVVPMKPSKKGWWLPLVILAVVVLYFLMPKIHFSLWSEISLYSIIALCVLGLIVTVQQSKSSLFCSMSLLFGFIFLPMFQQQHVLLQTRNFYGVKNVIEFKDAHVLLHQSTLHGFQYTHEKKLSGFKGYYTGTKEVVTLLKQEFPSMSVTLIGLGVGIMVCQFRQSDILKVVEIDQQVIDIAKNAELFTYLRDCPPSVSLETNDGRLALKQMKDASQNLLILDAFNSDSVPVHLLTVEAFNLYKKKITQDGAILVQLSNRHLDLFPVLYAAGQALNMKVLYLVDKGTHSSGQFANKWGLLTSNQDLALKLSTSRWKLVQDSSQLLWTDEFSNVVPLMRLF